MLDPASVRYGTKTVPATGLLVLLAAAVACAPHREPPSTVPAAPTAPTGSAETSGTSGDGNAGEPVSRAEAPSSEPWLEREAGVWVDDAAPYEFD